jgi:agmatinase
MRRRFGEDIGAADVVVWGVPFEAAPRRTARARGFGPAAIRRAFGRSSTATRNIPRARDPFAALAVRSTLEIAFEYERPLPRTRRDRASEQQDAPGGDHLHDARGDHFIALPLLRAKCGTPIGRWPSFSSTPVGTLGTMSSSGCSHGTFSAAPRGCARG